MNEAPTYYYETEIEWQGDKNLRLASAELPPLGEYFYINNPESSEQ